MNSKTAFMVAATMSSLVVGATPVVTMVNFDQDSMSRRVTIGYQISEPAIVTVDIQTNRGDGVFVSIGDEHCRFMTGAVNKLVDAVNVTQTINWQPDKYWNQPKKIKGDNVKAVVSAWATNAPPNYMVFNLLDLDEVRYYVSEKAFPTPITNVEYKTEKLVFRKISAADKPWRMGCPQWYGGLMADTWIHPHTVTLTEDYYFAIYEMTKRQHEILVGSAASYQPNVTSDAIPAGAVKYENLRGPTNEINWPNTAPKHKVKDGYYISRMRGKLGIDVDLPTRAQWEFAARAGTSTPLYSDLPLNKLCWNKGNYNASTPIDVGMFKPNAWGIYDTLGGVNEWALDWGEEYDATLSTVDPEGPTSSKYSGRYLMGGNISTDVTKVNSFLCAVSGLSSDVYWNNGYRLCAPSVAPHKTK